MPSTRGLPDFSVFISSISFGPLIWGIESRSLLFEPEQENVNGIKQMMVPFLCIFFSGSWIMLGFSRGKERGSQLFDDEKQKSQPDLQIF